MKTKEKIQPPKPNALPEAAVSISPPPPAPAISPGRKAACVGGARGSVLMLGKEMKLAAIFLLGIASAIPLFMLVTRADKRRQAVEALRKSREHGVITQEEFDRRTHGILNRSWWLP